MKDYADPRMHTVEHILNQTMVRMFAKGRSFSSHIEKKKSKCDYHFERNLSEDEVKSIEAQVNEIIAKGLPVYEEFLPKDVAAQKYDLGRIPQSAGEQLRIMHVGDYDACPCIGMHIENSSQIGIFRIISTSHENGVLRIRFKVQD